MKHRNRGMGVAAAIIVSFCAVTYSAQLAGRNLVRRSIPLGNPSIWQHSGGSFREFRWLTDTSFFSYDGMDPLHAPFRYDVFSHTKTPLTGLEDLFDYPHSPRYQQATSWELSPDRTHLLWNMNSSNQVHSAALDGTEYRTWRLQGKHCSAPIFSVKWLADGHRWIAQFDDVRSAAQEFSCVGSMRGADQEVLTWEPADYRERLALPNPVDWEWVALASTYKSHYFELNDGLRTRTELPVLNVGFCYHVVSPDHTHLAWLLEATKTNPFSRLHKVWPSYSVKPARYRSISISRIDGSRMHEVGRIDEDRPHATDDMIRSLQWMPDGKHMSYIDNDEIYGVDVSDCL